ncbi:MAG TPA: IS1182 family transposase [Candidatus Acidoferrum sp.]|nr:IS1182 family transposase [Candidatus Acidoferrum sp.]
MTRFRAYNPDQAYLLPPNTKDVLGDDHLVFFVHRVVERMDLGEFEREYGEEDGTLYAPALMLKVWLYAYALGMTSGRRLEQRIREDLAFRYLAAGETPDNWALSAFRRRHGRALNNVFTQVLEMARSLGMGRLGHVAIDSSRVKAAGSRERMDTEEKLRRERARLRRQVRRWQQACNGEDPDENAGLQVRVAELERRLEQLPRRLERLRKSGLRQVSRSDVDARFLRTREGWVLGYSAEVAVTEDHLIAAQRVTQQASDNDSLLPMVDEVERRCRTRPAIVTADTGFFSLRNLHGLRERGIEGYVPDANLSYELKGGGRAQGIGKSKHLRDPEHRRMRQRLRSPAGKRIYRRRKSIVEPVFGVLKQQRGMRQFRLRGLDRVGIEFTWASVAYNLTRIYNSLT